MKTLIILGSTLLIVSSSFAGLYRWVDDNGEVHFSDKIPAAMSQKAHSEIDKHGITRKSIDPEALKKDQEAAKSIIREREERALLAQMKYDALAKVRKRDAYLLSTYLNEQELSHFFENKIKLIKGNSSILSAQNSILAKKVSRLEKKIAINKDKATIESLEKRIVDINQTIKQYDKALLENDKELIKLSAAYKVDIKRFTELTQ